MMHLNSIWLEGNLISDPHWHSGTEGHTFEFRVASARVFRGQREVSIFTVEIRNPQVLDETMDLERGQGVRIIGRLEKPADGQDFPMTIVAEMVEKRPKFSLCGKNLWPVSKPRARTIRPLPQKQ